MSLTLSYVAIIYLVVSLSSLQQSPNFGIIWAKDIQHCIAVFVFDSALST